MAYNKSKYVEAAQKLLNQGKVAQAIAEYQQILKHEPRDQVTLMTVGELYIRQGETFQAIDYFERLAQIFVGDGFLTKAIAVYKRIAKLAPEEIRPLEKLADLYVQQGVMSEARPLFLQLAEIHLKNNRQPEAVALLKKLLAAAKSAAARTKTARARKTARVRKPSRAASPSVPSVIAPAVVAPASADATTATDATPPPAG